MRLLVVEDDVLLGEALSTGLRQLGHAVDWFADGASADAALSGAAFDAVVLDLGLPRGDGMAWLRRWRERGEKVPLLILTARDGVDDRIAGLDAGADDYLVKPYDIRELTARLRALIRRGHQPVTPERLVVGGLTIDTRRRRVIVDGKEILLRAKEYALLEFLARHAGDVVTRSEIAEHVWDEHYDPLSNVVDVYVQRLRRRFDRPGVESIIRTRRGEGYQLVVAADDGDA